MAFVLDVWASVLNAISSGIMRYRWCSPGMGPGRAGIGTPSAEQRKCSPILRGAIGSPQTPTVVVGAKLSRKPRPR